jgi:uncharacterized protein (DUF1499 family)
MRRFIYDEPVTGFAVWSRRIAILALIVAGYAVLIVRGGAQDWRGAVTVGAALALCGLAALMALIAFIRIWRRGEKGTGMAAQAVALIILLLAAPGYYAVRGAALPMLNDVSTDIDTPPDFSRSRASLAAREGRIPPAPPPGTRERQRAAYPDVVPILIEREAEDAFDLSRKAAAALGWRIIEATPPGGRTGTARIEAMHQTTLLRFTDDITIRIRPRADGARIDLRSASRVGRHDLGANARRIRRFAEELRHQAAQR